MNSSLSSIQSPASSVTQTATAFSPLTPLQLSVQLGSSLPPSPATSQKDYFIKRWFSQIYALIYKYLLESIHTPFSSLFIILSPAFIVLIISIAFQSISTSQSSSIASLFSHSYNLSRLTADCTQEICSSLIYYTPNDEFHSGIMKRLTQMNGLSEKRVRGFPTPEEMSKTILINSRSIIRQSPFVGISWTSTNTTNVSLAKISYNIWADLRFADSNETPLDFSLGPHHDIPLIFTSQTRKNSAKKYTFKPNPLSFQIAIESAIISYVSNPLNLDSAGTVYDVQWDWLNFKNGTADSPIPDESQLYMRLIPLMTLGSIPLLIFSVSFLCREKQYGGLIALHRMGLYESSLLISVATVLFIFNALSAVVFSASMKIVGMFVSWPIFTAIDLSVYFVVQFCFGCFLIGCGMLISSVAGSRPGYLYLAIGTFSAIVVTSTALCFYEVNGL
ncbi:hypothetical protein HK098_007670 [Nowakowskiella sp. JEL0407]|nr:hypothetical protein HK098_007670 [Nowakowskiella sp. JEL0407]